ncbi:MAG: deoxyribonuclease IV [Gemmataceae bacterium]|nr:deoxyribonuclease IV [Gemmataceae bacterium]
MPLFGAHLSIVKGLHAAVAEATALGCDTIQIFTKNASHWTADPLAEDAIRAFKQAVAGSALKHLTVHDSYLINLASADEAMFEKSIAAFVDEMERAESLGIDYLVTHPGAHLGAGEEAGVTRVIEGYEQALARTKGFRVRVLLETTAGQGTTLGAKFEHLGQILQRANCADRLGVCFDTCHVFVAGYPIDTEAGYAETFQKFDAAVGLSRLKLFHVNDSAKPLGSRVDRHAALGRGEIGAAAFRRLVNDPRFRDHPMILETPKTDDAGKPMDGVNLKLLRRLVR